MRAWCQIVTTEPVDVTPYVTECRDEPYGGQEDFAETMAVYRNRPQGLRPIPVHGHCFGKIFLPSVWLITAFCHIRRDVDRLSGYDLAPSPHILMRHGMTMAVMRDLVV